MEIDNSSQTIPEVPANQTEPAINEATPSAEINDSSKLNLENLPEETKKEVEGFLKKREADFFSYTRKIADEKKELSEKIDELSEQLQSLADEKEEKTVTSNSGTLFNQNETLTPEQVALQNFIDSRIETKSREIVRKEMQPLTQRNVNTMIGEMKTKYNDFLNYNNEIASLILRTKDKVSGEPTLTLEEAYFAVKGAKSLEDGKASAYEELMQRGKKNTVSPGSGSITSRAGTMSFDEALSAAMDGKLSLVNKK